jgi:hypothetical protein
MQTRAISQHFELATAIPGRRIYFCNRQQTRNNSRDSDLEVKDSGRPPYVIHSSVHLQIQPPKTAHSYATVYPWLESESDSALAGSRQIFLPPPMAHDPRSGFLWRNVPVRRRIWVVCTGLN